jgi:hypothetical protein
MYEYQIVIDQWEGNLNLDIDVLKSNGVVGTIVRINDMSGGSHMDTMFAQSWELSKQFPVSAIYFVYNPWVSGTENFNWLYTHLPANYKQRVFADIEVSKADYSTVAYANEVQIFFDLCKGKFPASVYTGEWFLHMLSYWPKDLDYWWAAYPDIFWPNPTQAITWDEFKQRLTTVSFAYNKAASPGNVILWQCSGDRIKLPGGNGHPVDVNIFPGNLDALKIWFNSDNNVPNEPPVPPIELPILDSGIVTTTSGLNVRSSPQISNNKLYALKYGSNVNIYEKLPSWYRINSTKEEYASSDYIKIINNLPVLYQAKVNAAIGLRVRSSPKIVSNNIIRTLPDKAIVNVYGVSNNWAKISSTLEEYVSNDYLIKIVATIDPKKGLAMAHSEFQQDLDILRIGWYYDWSVNQSHLSDSRYIPMSRDGSMVNLPDGYSGFLLFLNEPNQKEPNGCDLSASDAIIRYKALIAKYPNAKLICGNCSCWDTVYSGSFLGDFTKAISDQHLKVPYAYGLHGYIEEWIDVLTLENFWEVQHSICNTKIWISEFGDRNGNLTNFKQLIEWIKSKDWIERYAVFTNRSNGEDWAIGNGVNLIDWNTQQLTDIGKYYAGV